MNDTLLVVKDIQKNRTYFPKADGTAPKALIDHCTLGSRPFMPDKVYVYQLVEVVNLWDSKTNWYQRARAAIDRLSA